MAGRTNRQVLLASRPHGMVDESCFEMREEPAPGPGDGEFLVRNLYLSLDPAMRGWMSDAPSYMPPVGIGELMRGVTVGRVVESRNPEFGDGDLVLGGFGWQDYALSDGKSTGGTPTMRLPEGTSPTLPLSALGVTSLTAYFGLKDIGQPGEGDTVVVSGAAGATGSIVGQLAKMWGCRAIGIAGGREKCDLVTDEFGFDACVDYKSEDVPARLRDLCPKGLDVYFDNVGGKILEAALANLARGARVVICGAISMYNAEQLPPGPSNYMMLLVQRARMEGFLVFDFFDRTDEALAELAPAVLDGRIKYREDVRDGLENAPKVLPELYTGGNTGKLLIKIADPDEAG